MAEYAHDPAIGSWFFQAVVASSKLDRMTKNARAAHWNKPRGVRYRETALITTTQTLEEDQPHMLFLSGVRVIQGRTSPFPNLSGAASLAYEASDVDSGLWVGDPQLMFPTGTGLAPFVNRPVVTCNVLGLQVILDAPDPPVSTSDVDPDYSWVTWFGGLDWGDAATPNASSTPAGIDYHVDPLTSDEFWARCAVEAPIAGTHTGQQGAYDTYVGLRFRVIFGRVAGAFNFPFPLIDFAHPGAYYIHWHAMGNVAVY
jgi:hypothetical protein